MDVHLELVTAFLQAYNGWLDQWTTAESMNEAGCVPVREVMVHSE